MDAEAIMTVSAAVVALTQLAKWIGVSERWAPLVVLVLSARGALLWAVTQPHLARADAFSYFAGWIPVATSAAGVSGFTRAAANRVSQVTSPSNPTPRET